MVLNPAALLRDKSKFGSSAQVYSWVLFFLPNITIKVNIRCKGEGNYD